MLLTIICFHFFVSLKLQYMLINVFYLIYLPFIDVFFGQ